MFFLSVFCFVDDCFVSLLNYAKLFLGIVAESDLSFFINLSSLNFVYRLIPFSNILKISFVIPECTSFPVTKFLKLWGPGMKGFICLLSINFKIVAKAFSPIYVAAAEYEAFHVNSPSVAQNSAVFGSCSN